MKTPLIAIFLALAVAGCGTLIPKKVEFFQDKVKAFPEQSAKLRELEREAVYQSHEKATETVVAALKEQVTTNVLAPAQDTMKLTEAALVAAGPPEKIPTLLPVELAQKVENAVGDYNQTVAKFAKQDDKNAGKKIEGTGLIQVSYFAWIGGIALVIIIALFVGKLLLTGAAVANPGAAIGLNVVNAAQSVLTSGFSQLVKGGEEFKDWVTKEVSDSGLQKKILDAFQTSHMKNQDQQVQNVVAAMTK